MKRAPGVVRIAIAMRSNSIGHRIHFWRAHKREEWKIAVMIPQSSYKEAMDHLSNNLKKINRRKWQFCALRTAIACNVHSSALVSFIFCLFFYWFWKLHFFCSVWSVDAVAAAKNNYRCAPTAAAAAAAAAAAGLWTFGYFLSTHELLFCFVLKGVWFFSFTFLIISGPQTRAQRARPYVRPSILNPKTGESRRDGTRRVYRW